MEFCGGCGKELGRDLDRGRFCGACGHENPGNARYPLYAQGAAAAATAIASAAAPMATMTAVAEPVVDLTNVRLPAVPAVAMTGDEQARDVEPPTAWRTTLYASLAAMVVVVLLGLVLLLH